VSTERRPLSRSAGHLASGALLLLTLGACRSDSIVAPSQPDRPICETSSCEPGADAPKPNASIVIEPLEDASARILPYLMDARARADLAPVLNRLRSDLLAGNLQLARIQLAMAYDAVDAAGKRLGSSGDASVVLDLAELSAIRLSLVPAASALGVAAQ
jgi:hypothetical protein